MRKVIPFRYEESLDTDIMMLKRLCSYSGSTNKAITYGIKIAAAYARQVEKQKTIKDDYDLRNKLEEKLDIKFFQY